MCKAKSNGGIGFRNFQTFNCLLSKNGDSCQIRIPFAPKSLKLDTTQMETF